MDYVIFLFRLTNWVNADDKVVLVVFCDVDLRTMPVPYLVAHSATICDNTWFLKIGLNLYTNSALVSSAPSAYMHAKCVAAVVNEVSIANKNAMMARKVKTEQLKYTNFLQ